MKKRIVIEIDEEEYKALDFIKRIMDLDWKEFLIIGATSIAEWEEWKIIEKKIEEELKKIKKGG
ncbi:MAG: hypothetical protein QXS63_01095 [Zestosphaera sp.]